MKKIQKLVALLAAVAICVLVPGANTLTASAAEPVTYYVQYVHEEGDWRYQLGSWDDDANHRELYYMYNEFKDGDIVVVNSNGATSTEPLTFSKHVANLTAVHNSVVVASAPSFGEVFALQDSRIAVTGDVSNAYIYDHAGITFHSNVNKLTLIDTEAQSTGDANAAGTVGHVVRQTDSGYIYYQAYNVAAGKLVIEWGSLKTDPAYYSTTPTAVQTPAQAPATQPSASAGEYDDVPKTGESNIILWLVGIAAVCLAGKQALKRI